MKTRVNKGVAKRNKYDMCSANGWMTAAPREKGDWLKKKVLKIKKINDWKQMK